MKLRVVCSKNKENTEEGGREDAREYFVSPQNDGHMADCR